MDHHGQGHDHDHGTDTRHVPGTMDISAQQATFDGFLKGAAIVIAVTAAILIFLAFVGT